MSPGRTRRRAFPRLALPLASSVLALAAVTAAGTMTAGAAPAGPATAAAASAAPVVTGPVVTGPVVTGPVVTGAVGAGPGPVRPGRVRPGRVALAAFSQPVRTADAAAAGAAGPRTSRQIAWYAVRSYGWSTGQYLCLSRLWARESGWNPRASNPSGAYGIPQAMPGSKMASTGGDWRTSARTQIRWGLHYIRVVYGSPYGAWLHELRYGWY